MKAVVFVDVQKDFIDGALRNEKAIEVTPKIVEFAKECVEKGYKLYATRDTHEKTEYKTEHVNVEYPKDVSPEMLEIIESGVEHSINSHFYDTPISGYMTTLEGQKLPVEHCIEGTEGWMIDKRLWDVIEGKSTVINKPTFGSFDLAEIIDEDIQNGHILDNLPVEKRLAEMYEPLEEIILCGFCSSICVLANAVILRAKFPNVKITLMKDLCACVTEESHDAALKSLEMQQIDII